MATRSAFRFVSRAVAGVLLLALLLAGGGLYWLGTQHALEWLSRQAVAASEGQLVLEGVQGSLYGHISVSRAAFKDADLDVEARNVTLEWQPRALLKREARVTELAIDDLRIATSATGSAEPPKLPATLRLPLNATIADARVNRIEIAPGQIVEDLHFRLNAHSDALGLELVNVATRGWRAAGTMRVAAAAPFSTSGKFEIQGKVQGETLRTLVSLGGRLEALEMHASSAARGASAKATAKLRPFSALPLEKLTLEGENLDLALWDKAFPRTKISISLETSMLAPERFAGALQLKNDGAGPVDAKRLPLTRGGLSFAGSGTRWTVSDIDLGIGKNGRVRGSGSVDGANARLELALSDVATAELHSKLQPITVSGRAAISGSADAQHLTAKLEGAGAKLELAANLAQQVITVERGELRAENAKLDFIAHAALTANRAFSVDAAFSGFDPAHFINVPQANLNGKILAQGTLVPDWQAQVHVVVADSHLRGQPLAANAEFQTSAKQPFSGEAQAVYAGNRLEVSGRFGEPDDKLKWSLNATNLKAIDGALAGNVKAQGTLAGSIGSPSIDFKLTARKLAVNEITANAIDAQGSVDAGTDGALRLTAQIAGFRANTFTLDELALNAKGTRLRHEITAALRGTDISASINASGGLDDSWRWTGSLSALESRGRFPFRLTAPARVSAGRGLLTIDDLRATALGGEIGPAAVRIADGQITTRGAISGITAKALLALAPQTEIDPRDLTVGGRWDLAMGESVTGFAEMHRETGDLGIRAEKNLQLGLDKLQLRVSVESNALEAALEAQSSRMGTLTARAHTRVERRNEAWAVTKDAPLDGSVTLDMQSLAWVRALAPQLDQVSGRIAAQLTLAGTAGQPIITGDASADAVQVRAIGPGLNLSDGELRASFDGKTLNVSRLYLKAGEGKIEANGTADLSEGLGNLDITARADRARILDSPQMTVVLSGTGHAGLRDLKLALGGKLRIDEGRYDLGTERKPELGDDVVVVGEKPATAPGAKPVRIVLDVTIDLNDNFTVRGHGLDAVLGGSIRLATRGESLQALGTIHTVRGDYFAYGQELKIERGEINFSGPLSNPGINLRAGRKIKTVEVGVEVGGSLQRPEVTLVSDPVMSDSERLGWLVLGRDPQTASAAEMAILQAAALTTGTRRTTPLQKQIAEGMGLDEFGISQGGSGALGALALGKRITDQLTVRLEQSLGGTAGGLLKIDYLLSRRWRLEGTAGSENAADILFSLRFD